MCASLRSLASAGDSPSAIKMRRWCGTGCLEVFLIDVDGTGHAALSFGVPLHIVLDFLDGDVVG